MIFSSNKIIKIIKKNIEITFLFLLLLITISSTNIYNEKKVLIDENYKNLINNIYFQKSINQIFDNLVPRYKNIDHKKTAEIFPLFFILKIKFNILLTNNVAMLIYF